jgi:hypothetical protein
MAKTSRVWAIGDAISVGGGGKRAGGGIGLYSLIDVDNQIIYPLFIGSAGIGVSIPFGVTFAETGVYKFFETIKSIPASDFGGFVAFGTVLDASLLYGQSVLACITFHGVDHDPYWLDLSGLQSGISCTLVNVSVGYAVLGDPRPNNGCQIRPKGDPLCGGYTPAEALSSDGTINSSQ